jgi:hypothetical protein
MKMLRKRKKKIFAFEGSYADNLDERQELMQMFQNINRNQNIKVPRTTIGGPISKYSKGFNSDFPKLLALRQ